MKLLRYKQIPLLFKKVSIHPFSLVPADSCPCIILVDSVLAYQERCLGGCICSVAIVATGVLSGILIVLSGRCSQAEALHITGRKFAAVKSCHLLNITRTEEDA